MRNSEEYKRNAAAFRRLAEQTSQESEREAFLGLAAKWQRLAEHQERKESEASRAVR